MPMEQEDFATNSTSSILQEDGLRFFNGLCSRDPAQRSHALDTISRTFDNWLEGYGSPKETIVENNHEQNNICVPLTTDLKHLIKEQLPNLLRFSQLCPFGDVRERCAVLLVDLKDKGMKIPRRQCSGPSKYISRSQIVAVDTEDAEVQNLYVDAFLHNNRLEHMIQVMVYHPKYLESFLKTQQFLLRGDGPLPYPYRHYIALMAAGRHQCSYLISIHKNEFLLQGGDERWLKGLKYIPQKLQDLYEINKILAHRPWLINKSHIEKLTRGNDNWSLAELMHALTLLAHFHSLSGLVYGCGITPEIDQEDGHTYRPQSVSLASSPEDAGTSPKSQSGTPNSTSEEGGIEVLMERMKRLNEEAQEEIPQEELLKRFEKVESQSIDLPAASEFPSPNADILRFVEDPTFTYQDFAKRGSTSEIPTFRAQDYSWEEQGYSLANRLYPEIGTLLDDKFRIAYNLTYFTMGNNKSVDTTSFRRSIWNYIHCMFGIRHDDYDYCEVNQLLERHLRAFVKTVTCYPERISRKDYDSFMREFKHSEKVHVNLMLMEARLQGELLYALRAVMRHIT